MKRGTGYSGSRTSYNAIDISSSNNNNSTRFIRGSLSASSSPKWRLIDRFALKNLPPNASIVDSDINLIKASFNEAIDCLNWTAHKKKRLSFGNLGLILKKYQQNGMWERKEDALYLYNYIKITDDQEGNNNVEMMNEIHRCLIEFYVIHHDHFRENERFDATEQAKKIFDLHPSTNTFAALIQGYLKTKEYEKAWDLCKKEENTYRSGYLYDYYFKILCYMPETISQDKKTGIQRVREHYELISSQYPEALNTHSYRSLIELYKECLAAKQYNDKTDILLSEVNELYTKIPDEMKIDQVCRAMLKIILRYESFETAENFFNIMQLSKYVNLTDMSYQQMIKAYFDEGRYQDAENLLANAFKAGKLLVNMPYTNLQNYAELNLHQVGTTGGGTPFYGGNTSWFNCLAIHFLLLSLKGKYSNSGTYSSIKIKIICGKGAGKVRESVEEILNLYHLRYSIDGKNTGCLITYISSPELNLIKCNEFFIPKSYSNDSSQQIVNDSSKSVLHSQSTLGIFSGERGISSLEITSKKDLLVSLIHNEKKSINSNREVIFLFDNYLRAKNIQSKLLEAGVCDKGNKHMSKKITDNFDAGYNQYNITLSKDEYNTVMGENAFDELFSKINSTVNMHKR